MHGSRGGLGDGPYTSGKIHFFKYIVRLLKICLGPPPPLPKKETFLDPLQKISGSVHICRPVSEETRPKVL